MENAGHLNAIVKLFEALNGHGVRYCHWKSNLNLGRSLQGLTDLDILVDRRQGERFRLVLHEHEVKPILAPDGKRVPGLADYLGLDRETGEMFHLHVHYQLVLGEQFVKNYRLPIEPGLLEDTRLYAGVVRTPAPELELIVLAIRALLKYRDRDVVKDMLAIRSPGLPAAIQDEFNYLLAQTDIESVAGVLQSEWELLPSSVILEFLSIVTQKPRSGYRFYRLRRRLRRELAPYQRHSRWRVSCEYFAVLLRRQLSFLPGPRAKKSPVAGGMMAAVIGADGAGKSTIVNNVCRWLSWKMDVRRYYLGSQEPSRCSSAAHTVFRIVGSVQWRWGRVVGEQRATTRVLGSLRRVLHNVYHLSIARDRYRRYTKGRRQALQGAVVIFDRYPLEALHSEMPERPMDGPRIAAEAGADMTGLTGAMSRMEVDLYHRICLPDHLFILHVSPGVSRQRKSDHDHDVIEDKITALVQMDKEGLALTEIDADQPIEQVLFQIKTALWELL